LGLFVFGARAPGAHWRARLFVLCVGNSLLALRHEKANVLLVGWPYKKYDKNKQQKGMGCEGKWSVGSFQWLQVLCCKLQVQRKSADWNLPQLKKISD